MVSGSEVYDIELLGLLLRFPVISRPDINWLWPVCPRPPISGERERALLVDIVDTEEYDDTDLERSPGPLL